MEIHITKDLKYREQIIEYKFVSELMIRLAYENKKLELMRVHTDSFGYDLILKVDEDIKYVQIKSRKKEGRANYWDVHKSLLQQNNGFVLIIFFDFIKDDIWLEYNYLDRNKYGNTIKAEPKYKKDKIRYCKVSKKDLIHVDSIQKLIYVLFPDLEPKKNKR